jgi:hypothetical protein
MARLTAQVRQISKNCSGNFRPLNILTAARPFSSRLQCPRPTAGSSPRTLPLPSTAAARHIRPSSWSRQLGLYTSDGRCVKSKPSSRAPCRSVARRGFRRVDSLPTIMAGIRLVQPLHCEGGVETVVTSRSTPHHSQGLPWLR